MFCEHGIKSVATWNRHRHDGESDMMSNFYLIDLQI